MIRLSEIDHNTTTLDLSQMEVQFIHRDGRNTTVYTTMDGIIKLIRVTSTSVDTFYQLAVLGRLSKGRMSIINKEEFLTLPQKERTIIKEALDLDDGYWYVGDGKYRKLREDELLIFP